MHWICRNLEDFSEEQLQAVQAALTPSRSAHILRLRHREDQIRSLAAEAAVYQLLQDHYGITDAKLHREDSGRPYLSGCQLYVSIAHSGHKIACAVSENPVGIDIERLRPVGKKLCDHVCLPEEKAFVLGGSPEQENYTDEEVLRRFFQVWTAKEAQFKKLGTGITNFKSFNILTLPRQLELLEDYVLHIV